MTTTHSRRVATRYAAASSVTVLLGVCLAVAADHSSIDWIARRNAGDPEAVSIEICVVAGVAAAIPLLVTGWHRWRIGILALAINAAALTAATILQIRGYDHSAAAADDEFSGITSLFLPILAALLVSLGALTLVVGAASAAIARRVDRRHRTRPRHA